MRALVVVGLAFLLIGLEASSAAAQECPDTCPASWDEGAFECQAWKTLYCTSRPPSQKLQDKYRAALIKALKERTVYVVRLHHEGAYWTMTDRVLSTSTTATEAARSFFAFDKNGGELADGDKIELFTTDLRPLMAASDQIRASRGLNRVTTFTLDTVAGTIIASGKPVTLRASDHDKLRFVANHKRDGLLLLPAGTRRTPDATFVIEISRALYTAGNRSPFSKRKLTGFGFAKRGKSRCPDGHATLTKNLNAKAGGTYIWACTSHTVTDKPITDITFITGNKRCKVGYSKLATDLNDKTRRRGTAIRACVRRSDTEPPLTGLSVVSSSKRKPACPQGWNRIDQNLNEGARGETIYLCYVK